MAKDAKVWPLLEDKVIITACELWSGARAARRHASLDDSW